MNKICPSCNTEHDYSLSFCPDCGSRLMDDPSILNPLLGLGDANAISGGLNINQSKNISSNDTHYHSTMVERSKSEAEVRLESKNKLRESAERILEERGRIDSTALPNLKALSKHLGIDDDEFKKIIKEVRTMRRGGGEGLSSTNARYLKLAQEAIAANLIGELRSLMPRLEAMSLITSNEDVHFTFNLALSLIDPEKSVHLNDSKEDDNYWRSFWAIVATIRLGHNEQASRLLAQFDPVVFEKPEDDVNLLEALFNLVNGDKDAAQDFLDEILDGPSSQLTHLLKAIESIVYEDEAVMPDVEFHIQNTINIAVPKEIPTTASAISDVEYESKDQHSTMKSIQAELDTPLEIENEKIAAVISHPNNEVAADLYAEASSESGVKRIMLLQKAVEAGSVDAMYDLADCYLDGDGVEKDIPLAVKYVTQAAEKGHIIASIALGTAYLTGKIEQIEQNYILGEKYLKFAAERDNVEAQGFLASLYVEIQNYSEALIWARKGARMDNPVAEFMLGRCYSEGLGVKEDQLESLKWFEKSAEHGDADAQNIVGNIYSNGEIVPVDLEKAFQFYLKAAEQGHAYAMYNVALCYLNGDGTAIHAENGAKWMDKAAEAGVQEAIDVVNSPHDVPPLCDSNSTVLGPNEQPAYDGREIKNYKEKANIGDGVAMTQLALCYLAGVGVKQNDNMATMWFKRAVEAGNGYAALLLGCKYLEGDGYSVNPQEAAKWLRKGANLNQPEAMFRLGLLYVDGNGVVASQQKATSLIKSAADLGFSAASEYLQANPFTPESKKKCAGAIDNTPEITKVRADNSYLGSTNFINIVMSLKNWKKSDKCTCDIFVEKKKILTRYWDWTGCGKEELKEVGFAIPANDFSSPLKCANGRYTLTIQLTPSRNGRKIKFDVTVQCKFKIFSKDEIIVER